MEETRAIAKEFLNTIEPGEKAVTVALQGDLGAAKTAFTQAVGAELGISENMQSPTFVIMKVYDLEPTTNNQQPTSAGGSDSRSSVVSRWSKFFHIDAYRLESSDELLRLGWGEITKEPENLVFIEWPENVASIIPADARKISLEFVDETTREIKFES